MSRPYGVEAGRVITRDGKPFVSLNACKDPVTGSANFPYVDADSLARWIPEALNTFDAITRERDEAVALLRAWKRGYFDSEGDEVAQLLGDSAERTDAFLSRLSAPTKGGE